MGSIQKIHAFLSIVLSMLSVNAWAELHGRLPLTPGSTDYQAYYDDQLDVTWYRTGNFAKDQGLTSDGVASWAAVTEALADFEVNGIGGWRLPDVDRNGDGILVNCWGLTTQEACEDSELAHLFWYGAGTNPDGSEGIRPSRRAPFDEVPSGYFWSLNGCAAPSDPLTCKMIMGIPFLGYARAGVTSASAYAFVVYPGDVNDALVEICDNGVDDDLDGLVDGADPDCAEPEPEIDLLVRCLHTPLYPAVGERVDIIAEAIDGDGSSIAADRVEIYVSDTRTAHTVGSGARVTATLTAAEPNIYYGCRAEHGSSATFSGFRNVDVGDLQNPEWQAVPVFYSGRDSHKIDIVFFADPDFDLGGGSTGAPFQEALFALVWDGLFHIPWYVRNQDVLNLWIARDPAYVRPFDWDDPTSKCVKDKPGNFNKKYAFADAAGIIHDVDCRDNASFRTFSSKFELSRLQILAHELGHAAFSLSDEYEPNRGQTVYFTLPDLPNVFLTSVACQNAAVRRNKNPDACRSINGGIAGVWWIFEPDYFRPGDRVNETGDLMQQTGFGSCPWGGEFLCRRHRVGDSEIDRMNWKVDKCDRGRC